MLNRYFFESIENTGHFFFEKVYLNDDAQNCYTFGKVQIKKEGDNMKTILGDEYPILVDRKLARILGVNEAMVMQHIHYWLVKNEEKKVNYKEGRYWTFKSIKQWHDDEFDFWSESTLRRIFISLEEKGLLLVNNFNKNGFDKTKWYSIDYEKLYSLNEEQNDDHKEKNILINYEVDYSDKKNNNDNEVEEEKHLGIYEKIVARMEKKNKENSYIKSNECENVEFKTEIIQNEQIDSSKLNKDINSNWINADSQVDKSNYSNWINANSQVDKTNTNNYKKNINKDIKQLPNNGIDYDNIEKDNNTILKEFLGEEYNDEYAKRINSLLKIKGKDSAYLQEKIKFVKDMNPNSKCGYLYNAAKFDYKKRTMDFSSEENRYCIRKNEFVDNRYNNRNKFKNFKETVYKYTPEELEERVREHNRKKYEEIV